MAAERGREHVETLVIGGGQAGLSMGYQLSRRDLPYKIVDANPRLGDVKLDDPAIEFGREIGNPRALPARHRNHDVVCFESSAA